MRSIAPPSKRATQFANPFSAWENLATQTCEMLFASSQVIGYRSGNIARAASTLNQADQRELSLMRQEKIEAISESAQLTSEQWLQEGRHFNAMAFSQLTDGVERMLALALCPDPHRSRVLHFDWVESVLTAQAAASSCIGDSMAHVAQSALQPLHQRAVANARRLKAIDG